LAVQTKKREAEREIFYSKGIGFKVRSYVELRNLYVKTYKKAFSVSNKKSAPISASM
jgi:hypothetical protein